MAQIIVYDIVSPLQNADSIGLEILCFKQLEYGVLRLARLKTKYDYNAVLNN